ncbi:MAG: YceI family protein [Pseudomonadota bacterium]
MTKPITLKTTSLAAAAAALLALSAPAALASENYTFDPTHTWVSFTVNHAGWADAHGSFRNVSGEMTFDQEDFANSSVSVVIDAASIDTLFERRNEHLRSPDFLNAEEFPDITFESTSVEVTGENSGVMSGEVEFLGRTAPMSLDVTWNGERPTPWDETQIVSGFTATGQLDLAELGLDRAIQFGIGPMVDIRVDIEAVKD